MPNTIIHPTFACLELPKYHMPFQDLTVQKNLQHTVARTPDGTSEDDYFITDIDTSEQLITLTQADEFIRDEAEAGRIHGKGTYIDGYWENDFGILRFNLHTQWESCGYYRLNLPGGFAPLEGQPRIEIRNSMGMSELLNNSPYWNTQWLFLRMSTGAIPTTYVGEHLGGATQHEYTNAITVVKKNCLSGCWGGQNRISENSKWQEDKTPLKYISDPEWKRDAIVDSNGAFVHSIINKVVDNNAIILPVTFLHRPGFMPRRVFWFSEKKLYPIQRGNGSSGVVNVTLSLPKSGLDSAELFLCYPGGAKAVDICNLSLVRRARKVNLLVLTKQRVSGWSFAMHFAARLRKEHIDFSIKLLTGNKCRELTLKAFRQELHSQKLIIPEELSDNFGGNLAPFLKRKHSDLIHGVLRKGEMMLVTGLVAAEVALYMAATVKKGCWDKRWLTVKRNCQVTIFADKYAFAHIEKFKKPSGVTIYSGNISLPEAKHAVKDSSLVIFASQDMQRDKSIYHELLKLCIEQEISTIVFSEKPDIFTQQIAGQFYTLIGLLDGASKKYRFGSAENHFGVRFTLTQQAQLASCSNLLESELSEL